MTTKVDTFVVRVKIDLVLVCVSKIACFISKEIHFVFAMIVEINFISVWGVVLELISV